MQKHIATIIFLFFAFASQAEISITVSSCICEGQDSESFIVVATGSAGPFTFQWIGPEGSDYTSTVQNPDDITIPGIYTVIVTNAYGCETALSTSVAMCPGIENLELQVSNNTVIRYLWAYLLRKQNRHQKPPQRKIQNKFTH